jgi:hypothetical protein
MTVTVIAPVNTFFAAAAPLPAKSFSVSADAAIPWKFFPGNPEIVGTDADRLLVRFAELLELVDAEVFSTMLIVSVSPT